LRGSIKALTEILSLASPLIFGRATRLKQHARNWWRDWVCRFRGRSKWRSRFPNSAASFLRQKTTRSCITAKPSLPWRLSRRNACQDLSPVAGKHPSPRLGLRHSRRAGIYLDGSGSPRGAPQGESIPLGARILKLVSDYDFLEAGGASPGVAISTLQGRKGRYDPKLLGALGRVKNKAASGAGGIGLASLQVGMLLVQDVMSNTGSLLVPRGHEVTNAILSRLRALEPGTVQEPIVVFGP